MKPSMHRDSRPKAKVLETEIPGTLREGLACSRDGLLIFLLVWGWAGRDFLSFPPFFLICSPQVPKSFPRCSQRHLRFIPLCFAQTSTPFNMNYNPRVHIYFYFETGAAKRCSMFPKNLLMARSIWLFQKKIKSPCP